MTINEGLERLRKLMANATSHIGMQLSADGRLMTQHCTKCGAQLDTKMELSAEGDERMFVDLETFQRDHQHKEP